MTAAKSAAKTPTMEEILDSLQSFSVEELDTLKENVEVARDAVEKRKRAEAIEAAEEAAQKHGFSLGDILTPREPGTKSIKLKKPGLPKYKHPENPATTWTGKGRKPAWVNDHLEQGGTLEDLAI